MIDISNRSYEKEILDQDNIPFAEIQQNMKELNFINTHLGGHLITVKGFKKLLANRKIISVCEIGCGGGDNLRAINKICMKKNIQAKFIGVDTNADCIAFAKNSSKLLNVDFIISDYRKIDFGFEKPDIIFSSLFCHHFTDVQLIEMLQWMKANSKIGFFINDLHRHKLAYYFIKFTTQIFSKSYLVKNDAPLSVLRGFTKSEWKSISQKAGIKNFSIGWKWAFRYLIIAKNDK